LKRLTRHPHRGTATAEEAAAAGEIRQWLSDMGYACEIQAFATPRDTLYLGPSAVMAGFLVAAAVGRYRPWAGLLLALALLVPLAGEMLGSLRVDLDLLLPRYRSQNVVARSGSAGGRRTLVVSGHYDTQRASLLFHPQVAPWIQPYFYLVYGSLLSVPVTLGLRWALPAATWTGPMLAAGSALLVVHTAFLVLCRVTGRYINGANDNGSGVSLVLALAERFARTPLPETEVIFLLTGAEEVGTRGMKAFMRRARLDPATTRFVNLDNIGGGRLHYLTGEGMLAVKPFGPELLALAGQMAAEQPGQVAPRKNLLLPTDGLIPATLGYQAISFLAFLDDGSLPNYHWYTDTFEQIDLALLDFAEEFLADYLRRLATAPVVEGARGD
jgi:hypothetical protein